MNILWSHLFFCMLKLDKAIDDVKLICKQVLPTAESPTTTTFKDVGPIL